METTPILEMARTYGLPPRLWLLVKKMMMEIVGACTELFGSHRRHSEIFESIQVIFEKLRKSSDDLRKS